MNKIKLISSLLALLLSSWLSLPLTARAGTRVAIHNDQFFINDQITYQGRYWGDVKIEGLLFNSRMVQGIFDDLNPASRDIFKYPDTNVWDAERNSDEFIEAMPEWREHGLLAFTLNLQGGSPMGYGNREWVNSAFTAHGALDSTFLRRLEKILNRADQLGMVVILGYFYFGQDQILGSEQDVIAAVDHITDWILAHGYQNILIEINNECDIQYDHEILQPERVHELIRRVQLRSNNRLLVGTSFSGGFIPLPNVVKAADFILLHGNGVEDPAQITQMVTRTRQVSGYTSKPILFNEDDHYNFDAESNNMVSATRAFASWGYFDYRKPGEPFAQGFQTVPVDWRISSARKVAFFNLLSEITGCPKRSTVATWRSLFNNVDLQGWVIKAKPEDLAKKFWSVDDSMIIANSLGDAEHDYVWLMTEETFDDFELSLLFQAFRRSPGNSGVQIRSRYDDDHFWLDGPQIDIHPPDPWRTGMMWDETRGNQRWIFPNLSADEWVNPQMAHQAVRIYYADNADVWNHLRIRAEGMTIKAWLNGTLITDFNGANVLNDSLHQQRETGKQGHIALQIHTKDELLIHFKDIQIRP